MKSVPKVMKISRRDFLKLTGITGTGLVIGAFLDACASTSPETATVATVTSTPLPDDLDATPRPPFEWEPDIYLMLGTDGMLTVTAFRSEMGQGIRTTLAMLAADELDVPWESVRIEQAPADGRYGDQVTGGSASVTNYYDVMRYSGALARLYLVSAAAQAWAVEAGQCTTDAGFVVHPDGTQKLAYGDLVESAAELDISRQDMQVKEKSQFRIIGQPIGHWDARQIVTGEAIYGLDVRLPGMLYAAIARCPVFDGSYVDFDDSAARSVLGVLDVVEMDDRIAVVAENSWAAIQGRDALEVTWDEGRMADLSSEELAAAAADKLPEPGSLEGNRIDALYEIPFEAHATMEPMNCTAFVHDDVCEVWAPTQNPQEVQRMVSRAIGFSRRDVIVNVPLIGGGFGRRLEGDYAVEAAQLSQAIQSPVQVLWTRADDLQHDFYHSLSVQYLSASLDDLRVPRNRIQDADSGVPTGAWRSVFEFTEAFGAQSFIDEMAFALERNPLDLRLELYDDRAVDVIKLAAEKAGWGQSLPIGWGRGMAYHATFDVTHVAQVVEVEVDESGNIRVQRVVCAVDCGQVVNPDNVAAQMEGGIVFGLTAALKAEATLLNGRIQQSNFHDYPILQMGEMPFVEVYIIESDNRPTGIGEMGVPPIAPAVANAVFAATGRRIRHIPIRPEDFD